MFNMYLCTSKYHEYSSSMSVCVCNWVFTDVYQSDMIIYVWDRPLTSPSERRDSVSNLRPRLNQFVTSTASWITGARHNA